MRLVFEVEALALGLVPVWCRNMGEFKNHTYKSTT